MLNTSRIVYRGILHQLAPLMSPQAYKCLLVILLENSARLRICKAPPQPKLQWRAAMLAEFT